MNELFNKEALEALDDHSEAEEMARVASPKLKLVLGAMLAMVAVAVYWCAFGTINYKVTAQGIVFPFGDVTAVSVPEDAVVDRVLVNTGQTVEKGEDMLTIRGLQDAAITAIAAPRDGVVLNIEAEGEELKMREPVAWLLPKKTKTTNSEMLCYVTFDDLRKLKVGQQVQATPADLQRENWGYAYGEVVGIEQYPTTKEEVARRLKLEPLSSFIQDGQAVYEIRVILTERDGNLVWSREKSRGLKVGTGTLCNIQVITERKPVWRVLIGAVDNAAESVTGN
jgi:hypothetical protein